MLWVCVCVCVCDTAVSADSPGATWGDDERSVKPITSLGSERRGVIQSSSSDWMRDPPNWVVNNSPNNKPATGRQQEFRHHKSSDVTSLNIPPLLDLAKNKFKWTNDICNKWYWKSSRTHWYLEFLTCSLSIRATPFFSKCGLLTGQWVWAMSAAHVSSHPCGVTGRCGGLLKPLFSPPDGLFLECSVTRLFLDGRLEIHQAGLHSG